MSHRRLIHRHPQRILTGADRELAPGDTRLYSYAPSLTTGLHTVTVKQEISVPKDNVITGSERETTIFDQRQDFIVVAPRFSLPPGTVDSVFPTPGSSAEHVVLPHIVLRDPHLPWQSRPTHIPDGETDGDLQQRTTWLALLSFPMNELLVSPEVVQSVMQNVPEESGKPQLTNTWSLRMRAQDTALLQNVVNATGFHPTKDARDASESTNVVLLQKDLFIRLFSDPGSPPTPGQLSGYPSGEQVTSDVELNVAGYKYFAHVRQVATDGMAQAGAEADGAMFSVVISRRTGPIDSDVPVSMAVHLLSLDWDTEAIKLPLPGSDDTRVAVTSLHSWTYTCLPSKNAANSLARLTNLGEKLTVLRTNPPYLPSTDPAVRISQRQADGYTLTRHRTATGEVTAAIVRGPFTPTQVARPLHDGFSMRSNFGSDLAILDSEMGLLDITYSSAWQLGKTLALGDGAFCTALGRLRGAIRAKALNGAKQEVHAALRESGYVSVLDGGRRHTAGSMMDMVQGLNALKQAMHDHGSAGISSTAADVNRWSTQKDEEEASILKQVDMLSQKSPHIAARIGTHADTAALDLALTAEIPTDNPCEKGAETAEESPELYNEYSMPENPDYALVYSWIMDKVHLGNVPAHYLIPDPAFLPDESLRLFHVDANWTDALIDGALSLANHCGGAPDEDHERIAIKTAVNARLRAPDAKLGGWHVQMPRYGFVLRSQLLVQFPDLAVSVHFAPERREPVIQGLNRQLPYGVPPQQPILVQKRLAPDTMYCLFDAAPPDLQRITFTMPTHQQCFTVGQALDSKELTVLFKKVYATESRPRLPDGRQQDNLLGRVSFKKDGTPAAVFDWDTSLIHSAVFAEFQRAKLFLEMGKDEFTDKIPTSALLGLQLNDPLLQLDIVTLDSTNSNLVFDLRPPGSEPIGYIYALTKIIVAVPYGKMPEREDDPDQPTPRLAATADPPVPTMLPNMRLNVLRRWGQPDEPNLKKHVVFELVPREQPGMPFEMLNDAGFWLPRAQVARYDGDKTRQAWIKISSEVDQVPPQAPFFGEAQVDLRPE
ncbi:hypothetical protein S40293_02194 [Stachybotrys chartarum IBT 40293]|nr:hypothetical protein S40293_02194 [Stachybotrys chartarum IBT 40293]